MTGTVEKAAEPLQKPAKGRGNGNSHRANSSARRGSRKTTTAKASHKRRGGDGETLLPELRALVQQSLDHATYIVFDIETTGGNPERNGITEIAALKIVKGEIADRFYSLVNPMIPIPPIVRRMTGITNQLVKDAPVIDEIYPDFAEFIGDHILVSHNTIGDLIFLRHFARDTIGRDLKNFFLCTHLLVEKLVGDAPDKSLKGLSKFFRLAGAEFHRAEADAIQTWELFKILLKRLKERGVNRVEHAIRLQGDLDSSLRLGWSIGRDKLASLPASTGLFYLYDHERRLLFLSSAASISREVDKLQQHDLIPRQILKLALRSYDLQVTRTPNLFMAMLAECAGREKHSIQADPISFHQRQVQVLGIYEDKKEGLRIAVGSLESNLRYAFGPVRDRKRAIDFVEDLADILQEKITRTGMLISKENQTIVTHLLAGTLLEYQKRVEKNLFGLRFLFWRREAAREQHRQFEKISSLMVLQNHAKSPWPAVSELCGIIVVPDEGNQNWQIHTIVSGLPTSVHQIKGEWQTKLCQGGSGKRIYNRLEREQRVAKQKSLLTPTDISRMNAVLWWLQFGKAKDRGYFLELHELGALLSLKKSRSNQRVRARDDSAVEEEAK